MIVYFSGPHGAGKSSLIKGVCEYPPFLAYPDRLKFVHLEEPRLRHKSKIAKFYQEYCDQLKFQEENPDKIILGDRCIYDSFVYGRAFSRLGWLSKEENKIHEEVALKFFLDEMPKYLVILNPPLECIVEHLRSRWKKGKKKWKEENIDYLKAACDEFAAVQDYFSGKSLLYIGDKLSVEEEVNRVLDWAQQNNIVQPELLYATEAFLNTH